MKRLALIILLLVVSLPVLSLTVSYLQPWSGDTGNATASLQRFPSYDALKAFLNTKPLRPIPGYYDFIGLPLRGAVVPQAAFTEQATSTPAFSSTNIQVAGVDEADIVKTDGQYLYLATDSRVFIVKAYPPSEAALLSQIDGPGMVHGLFVNRDRLVLLYGGTAFRTMDCLGCTPPFIGGNTTLRVYDLADRRTPTLIREVVLPGWYVSSRLIQDYVYVVASAPAMHRDEKSGDVVLLPTLRVDEVVWEIPATAIYYSNVTDYSYSYTIVLALNTQDALEEPALTTILTGATSTIYVSTDNIYLTMTNWQWQPPPVVIGPTMPASEPAAEQTVVHRLAVTGREVKPVASGTIPGHVLNQFSMDEYQGHFRIATTEGWQNMWRNNLYILNADMNVTGKLEGVAPGERIYSVRFMGSRAYVVTFKKIDPLFVIDVSDPAQPTILGQLKIPGYSDYLHPYDETHLIGLGKEAVPAEEGDFAWYQGLKLSLFDVSEVSRPKELATLVLGDRGTESPALYDHKAFLFDRERNLLVIPVLLAQIDPAKYPGGIHPSTPGDFVFQGAYVFNVTLDKGITVRGRITHLPDTYDLQRSGYNFDSDYTVTRSLYIGDFLYTISPKKIGIHDLATLEKHGEVALPATPP